LLSSKKTYLNLLRASEAPIVKGYVLPFHLLAIAVSHFLAVYRV